MSEGSKIYKQKVRLHFSHYTKLGSAIGIVTVLIISLLVFGENVIMLLIVYINGHFIFVNKGIKEIMKRSSVVK